MKHKLSTIQVKKEIYFEDYDSVERFIAYFYQTNLTKSLKPKTCLEIGVGNGTVSTYLKRCGIDVTTCDFDKSLEPDIVADVRTLTFKKPSFDVVLACEILEHLPWSDLDAALNSIRAATKKYVIISVPRCLVSFEFILKFPMIEKIFKTDKLNLFFRIPWFRPKVEKGEHYWEIDKRGFPISKVRKKISTYFKIKEEVRPLLGSYYHFFILEK